VKRDLNTEDRYANGKGNHEKLTVNAYSGRLFKIQLLEHHPVLHVLVNWYYSLIDAATPRGA
jgi:hypothetical protein